MEALPGAKAVKSLHRDVRALIDTVKKEREASLREFTSAIKRACKVGANLILIKNAVDYGQWGAVLVEVGMKERNANNWMAAAREFQKDPVRVGYLIASGAPLCAIWREEGLQKNCESGKYDPKTYRDRLLRNATQLSFSFEEFDGHLDALIAAPNVEELGETTRARLKKKLSAALKRIEELEQRRAAINIETEEAP